MRSIIAFSALLLTACAAPEVQQVNQTVNEIYWSDGDSGRINGMKFRLANVDAPETGGVGARGGAKCEAERVLGYIAKGIHGGSHAYGAVRDHRKIRRRSL